MEILLGQSMQRAAVEEISLATLSPPGYIVAIFAIYVWTKR
jgi:hypothetical protein